MKTVLFLLALLTHLAAGQEVQWLGPPRDILRASPTSFDRAHFLSEDNIQRAIVLPTLQWRVLDGGPEPLIKRFKKIFESERPIVTPSSELERRLMRFGSASSQARPDNIIPTDGIRWSDIYFLTKDGDFLTFGLIDEGFVFFTKKTVGLLPTTRVERDGAANPAQGRDR